MRRVSVIAAASLVLIATIASASSEPAISPAERAKIEQLITVVENLSGAHFIRNGKAYDSSTAAKFLRLKWKDREASVHNAGDFIDKIATRSSMSGRPYLIRFDDGRELSTAAFFRAELAKLK